MNKKIIILFILTLGLLSCKKDSVTVRTEFIGFWSCYNYEDQFYHINIGSDGYGVYSEYNEGKHLTIEGDARANDKKLKIGSSHHFTITEYPHRIDTSGSDIWVPDESLTKGKKANWKMTLKGPNFYLGDGVYYKADY
jgi:hypothetical protein